MPVPWDVEAPLRAASPLSGETLAEVFWSGVQTRAPEVIMRQKSLGIWQAWSWEATGEIVREITMGLIAMGLLPGECVSILAGTSIKWVWCDMAALSAGGVSNGIYQSESAGAVEHVCADSRTVILFVEDEEQLEKAFSVRSRLPSLRHIVVLESRSPLAAYGATVSTLAEVRTLGARKDAEMPLAFDRARSVRKADDLAVLVYTSGTTGVPKGAMHSNRGVLAAVRGACTVLPQGPSDERVCFLPLPQVTERIVGLYASLYTGAKLNFVENADTVTGNVREIAPTVFSAVPRLWEKFYSATAMATDEAGAVQRWAYAWALSVGYRVADRVLANRHVGAWLKVQYHAAGLVSLNNVRRFIGLHRCRFAVTASAPIAPHLVRWYLALGVPLLEIWGQAECAGIATSTPPNGLRLGSIGRPCEFNEVQIDRDTGELLVRGPNVFSGYFNDEHGTNAVIDATGWLRTGDIGSSLSDGYINFLDRNDDLISAGDGSKISRTEWERQTKLSPYVMDAALVRDAESRLTALILIERENAEKFARLHRLAVSNYASLTQAPEIRELVRNEIARFTSPLKVGRVFLLNTQLSPGDEEMTPTMRLKRRIIEQKYAAEIASA
jgi:long-chain acyl-CoA synthetase